jgi:putative DNA primase/helicase
MNEQNELNGLSELNTENGTNGRNETNGTNDRELHGLHELHRLHGEEFPVIEPWPEVVNGKALLDELEATLTRFVVLPKWAAETLAMFTLHTYAYELRDVTTYVGIESPEKRCGKTTLLTVLGDLVNRPVMASNISSPAFFRVIQQTRPTLLIDEADTFLQGNDELRGILNSGYTKKTAFVWRVANEVQSPRSNLLRQKHFGGQEVQSPQMEQLSPSSVKSIAEGGPSLAPAGNTEEPCTIRAVKFSCWCPKVMAAIGRLPETLADRCIVIRMQRKMWDEECDWVRNLNATVLVRKCARFVQDHAEAIRSARPEIPESLNDRAGDIWEPLLALADLAGGDWPQKAREAAVALNTGAQESSPIGTLLLDIFTVFVFSTQERMFSRSLVEGLNVRGRDRAWMEELKGKAATELWLSRQLKPYGIRPKTMRIGDGRAKGYIFEEFEDVFRRYIPMSEVEAMKAEMMEAAKYAKETSNPDKQNRDFADSAIQH